MERSVLVASEDPSVLQTIRLATGHPRPLAMLQICDSATAALRCLNEGRFITIIADLMLPYGSGYQILSEARRRQPAVPVLVLLEASDYRHAEQALHEGASGILWKPVQPSEAWTIVREAMLAHRRHRLSNQRHSSRHSP